MGIDPRELKLLSESRAVSGRSGDLEGWILVSGGCNSGVV